MSVKTNLPLSEAKHVQVSFYPHKVKDGIQSFIFLPMHHLGLKMCLLKKLFPTLLTRLLGYDILALRDKKEGTFNEKIY
ncbi:MAG: hypothetical protein IKJ00_07965, partial [Clostridia bacterium]|nr:hypothetical protein [Clostridia bacterium]